MNDFPNWIQIVSNVGFPVVVALYLLIRVDKTIEKSTETIGELTKVIIQLQEVVKSIYEVDKRKN